MQRSHAVRLALASLALSAAIRAQCVAPVGPRSLETLFAGTTFFANTTPPTFGVSLDPGVAVRFDLSVGVGISIDSIGTNLLNDGGTYAGVTVPNLIGAPNGTMEVWISGPPDTVLNAALFTNNPYTHLPPPGVPPIAPWVQLSNPATHLDNLVFSAPDTASVATFNPPLQLPPGDYAVVAVLVPQGVAGPAGVAANPATDRIHPLLTNLNTIPGPVAYSDQFLKISNPGVQSPAFVNGALQPTSPTPFMPNLRIDYTIPNATTTAFSTSYGAGCYDSFSTFYEEFVAPGSIDLSTGALNGLDFFNLGSGYIVTTNPVPGLFVTPGSTAGALQLNTGVPALSTGAWDDATSGPISIPFTFNFPGGAGTTILDVSSNGIVYLETATTTFGFYNGYAGFLANQPAIAAAWGDLEPADLNTFLGGTGDLWVDFDPLNQWVAVTWDGCQVWNEPTNINTAQVVLFNGGNVSIRYGGQVNFTNAPFLVGFTPGNGAPDPGSGPAPRQFPDLSVAGSGAGFLSGGGNTAANISLQGRPRIGQPLVIDTKNVVATSAANLTVLSGASLPGVGLNTLGMPGCSAWVSLPAVVTDFAFGPGPYSWNVTGPGGVIPAAVVGVNLFAQSVQFDTAVPPPNAASLLVSDAVCIHFDVN
ncbi:MAG: hypothetical protein AB7O97_06775 [Planctomycetota bacterium]